MEKRLPIKLITRNSKINNLVQSLFAVGIIALAILYISMAPSEHSSVELKAFWFIKGVPMFVKQIALYGIITLIIAMTLNLINTRSKYGELLINNQAILIILTKRTISIETKTIKEILVTSNPVFFNKNESESIKIFIRTKKGQVTKLKLFHYLLADDLVESLKIIDAGNIDIKTGYGDPHWMD